MGNVNNLRAEQLTGKLKWDKLPCTGISHAKLMEGVVSWHWNRILDPHKFLLRVLEPNSEICTCENFLLYQYNNYSRAINGLSTLALHDMVIYIYNYSDVLHSYMYHVWHNVHLIHTHQFEQSHYLDEGPPLRAQDPGHTPYQQVHYPNPGQNYWINALAS